MDSINMFSRLSRGYGTWDGIAKRDAVPEVDREFFSLSDLQLPPIGPNYKRPSDPDLYYGQGTLREKSTFRLPDVNQTKQIPCPRPMPKTYTTRKGALLLYAEGYFLPGSPKPKRRLRRKIKKTPSAKLKTLTDLRDFILNYKRNGGDPLFLALLQKRLSGYHDHRVRPGFSPKRYIATLGRSLQEDAWNKLAHSGSFKDPALLTYNPFLPPVHADGSLCDLFPEKPQPYSTMSLPPVSPSSSMLGSSWNFYNNGMSTGAASMVSINSEEYAPSSRAISPSESLHERLSEVEPAKRKKDFRYALLDPKQKEELLSQMLVQKTLESVDSDLQNWPSNFTTEKTGTKEQASSRRSSTSSRKQSKASLNSASLSSIPRLPPIQSASVRASSTEDREGKSKYSLEGPVTSLKSVPEPSKPDSKTSSVVSEEQKAAGEALDSSDAVDLDGIQFDLSEDEDPWDSAVAKVANQKGDGASLDREDSISHLGPSPSDENTSGVIPDNTAGQITSEHQQASDGSLQKSQSEDQLSAKGTETSRGTKDAQNSDDVDVASGTRSADDVTSAVTLDDVMVSSDENVTKNTDDDTSATSAVVGASGDDVATERTDDAPSGISVDEDVRQSDDVGGDASVCEPAAREESADLEGEEGDDSKRPGSADNLTAGSVYSASTTSLSIHEDNGPSPEPPPPITFEQLQDEARVVASRVLNRPQSGAVFVEDARAALMMWTDRLSSLLGPPTKDARTCSAALQTKAGLTSNAPAVAGVVARKRKVSRSAAPLAALRHALLISGGEIPNIEALRDLPPVQEKARKPTKQASGVASGHTYYEPLKDGESRSNRDSGSPGPTRSIVTDRLSNSDLQMEIFNYVTKDEQEFEQDRARVVEEEDSGDEAEFQAALDAVVTELQQNVAKEEKIEKPKPRTKSKPKSPPKTTTEKTRTPPFQVTRPKEEKPPPGLKEVPPQGPKKIKTAKKAPRKEGKKGGKPTAAKPKPQPKNKKGKEEKPKDEDEEHAQEITAIEDAEQAKSESSVEEKIESSEKFSEKSESPEPSVRVDSETGDEIYTVSATPSETESYATTSMRSRVSTSKGSSSPSVSTTASILEQPKLVPKLSFSRPEEEAEKEAKAREEEEAHKEAELAKQREKEARAAKRAEERAAAAEKRRQEVERKRREREEAKRKQLEEAERLERVRLEAEEEMKRREEERRKKREEAERERKRKEEEERNREKQEKARLEREKRMREDFERKKQELIAQRKLEEEIRREQEKIDRELEEAARREEEERIRNMEESERLALQEKMRREEEELRRRLEDQRRREEEERRVLEEQKRLRQEALALLRQKRIKRHLFITGIMKEMRFLGLGQRLTRAFTFSYFDELPWNYLRTRPTSPMKNMIEELKASLPPTIIEEDETEED
ncbi:titin homolog [Nematostella vectensis]|uniref:titin homolog n=1 Tax=Nematostella vectensis TaxID=45351 RepID=UPI0020772A9A|nr:titin homolog [Nematostella vectensis]